MANEIICANLMSSANTVGPLEVHSANIEITVHWIKVEETEEKNKIISFVVRPK